MVEKYFFSEKSAKNNWMKIQYRFEKYSTHLPILAVLDGFIFLFWLVFLGKNEVYSRGKRDTYGEGLLTPPSFWVFFCLEYLSPKQRLKHPPRFFEISLKYTVLRGLHLIFGDHP